MMTARIEESLQSNEAYVAEQLRQDANYFDKLADGQHPDATARLKRVVEFNVIEQVYDLGKTSIVQKSWAMSGKP